MLGTPHTFADLWFHEHREVKGIPRRSMMELSRSLARSPSGESQAVKRGEKLSREGRFTLL